MNFAGMVTRCLQAYAVSVRPGCETWLHARSRDSLLLRAVNPPYESSSGMTKQARVSLRSACVFYSQMHTAATHYLASFGKSEHAFAENNFTTLNSPTSNSQ